MVSRCRSHIGKRLANTTCDTFRSIPTDENGGIAKVEQSTPNLTSCGPCTSGVTRSSRTRSGCDLPENRACLAPRANVTAWLTGSRRVSHAEVPQYCRGLECPPCSTTGSAELEQARWHAHQRRPLLSSKDRRRLPSAIKDRRPVFFRL